MRSDVDAVLPDTRIRSQRASGDGTQENITVYAKWLSLLESLRVKVTVRFSLGEGIAENAAYRLQRPI
jgi:hypothetical protein